VHDAESSTSGTACRRRRGRQSDTTSPRVEFPSAWEDADPQAASDMPRTLRQLEASYQLWRPAISIARRPAASASAKEANVANDGSALAGLSDRPMMKPYRPVPRDWSIIRKIVSGSIMLSYGLLTRDCKPNPAAVSVKPGRCRRLAPMSRPRQCAAFPNQHSLFHQIRRTLHPSLTAALRQASVAERRIRAPACMLRSANAHHRVHERL